MQLSLFLTFAIDKSSQFHVPVSTAPPVAIQYKDWWRPWPVLGSLEKTKLSCPFRPAVFQPAT
jgi:hypothetical protein